MTVSTISALAEHAGALGEQQPRIEHVPSYASSTGDEAIELAEIAGLTLDDWQQHVLRHALGERLNGDWAGREIGLMVSRQNGKGSILEARELAGLFLLGEGLIIHTAHRFDTSAEHFQRLCRRVEETPELDRRVDRILRAHGKESIELLKDPRTGNRPRITFRTRTGAGGLGFSCDLLIFDEAMVISEAMHGALLPTLSARPNMQVWYTGSAVDQRNPAHQGVVFARVRERGIKGSDPSLAYFEWSASTADPERIDPNDEKAWAQANPGLGIRISREHVALESRSMDRRTFAVQRLGVGDWPRTDGLANVVISPEKWTGRIDRGSTALDPVCFSIDVMPDRSAGAIGVAGKRADGDWHVELARHKRGTGWIVKDVVQLVERHKPLGLVLDAAGAASSLLPLLNDALKDAGLMQMLSHGEVVLVSAREHSQACGAFYDAVEHGTLWHLDEAGLANAIQGAVRRTLGEAWAWSRKDSTIDISPLVAVTLALWGMQTLQPGGSPEAISLNAVYEDMQARELRKEWEPLIAGGDIRCHECERPIEPETAWRPTSTRFGRPAVAHVDCEA